MTTSKNTIDPAAFRASEAEFKTVMEEARRRALKAIHKQMVQAVTENRNDVSTALFFLVKAVGTCAAIIVGDEGDPQLRTSLMDAIASHHGYMDVVDPT